MYPVDDLRVHGKQDAGVIGGVQMSDLLTLAPISVPTIHSLSGVALKDYPTEKCFLLILSLSSLTEDDSCLDFEAL